MGAISEQALAQLHELGVPKFHDESFVPELEEGYWADRHDRVRNIIGDVVLTDESKTNKIIATEIAMPAQHRAERYTYALRFALDAVLIDDDLSGAERLEHLIELEGGKSPSGFGSHKDAAAFIIKTVHQYAADDGLVLRLDYSGPADGLSVASGGTRKFVSATPYQIDVEHMPRYVFERAGLEASPGSYLAQDSGLHIRTTTDVFRWQQRNSMPEVGSIGVYGVYTHAQDLTSWSPYGSAWSSGEYPDRGPSIHFGQSAIVDSIQRRLTYGGSRLDKLQQDIGDYPGFSFVHDIEPTGRPGADANDLA